MLSPDELTKLANQQVIAQYVVLREYCQAVILQSLSAHPKASHFIFKGGTAIRFFHHGHRFSEDLDFTLIGLEPNQAEVVITQTIAQVQDAGTRSLKPLKTLAGKSFRLTWQTPLLPTPITIKLDLSFRESVIEPTFSLLQSIYPLLSQNYLHHYTAKEIVAEKVRALLHRHKGRDLYDLWFLLSMQTEFNPDFINQKMNFYQETFSLKSLLNRIITFPTDQFVSDLSPFLGKKDRDPLPTLLPIIQTYLASRLA